MLSSVSFSQRVIRNEAGDTSICFTIDQSRILLKQINKLNYLDSLDKINQVEISTLKSNLQLSQIIVSEKDIQIKLKDEIIYTKDEKIKSNESEYKNLNNLLLKEKVKKWIAIATGTITTGFMTYLWITK